MRSLIDSSVVSKYKISLELLFAMYTPSLLSRHIYMDAADESGLVDVNVKDRRMVPSADISLTRMFLVCLDSYDIITCLVDSCTAWKSVLTSVGRAWASVLCGPSDTYIISRNCLFTWSGSPQDDETRSRLSSQATDNRSGFLDISSFDIFSSKSDIFQIHISFKSLTNSILRFVDNDMSDGQDIPGTLITPTCDTLLGCWPLKINISLDSSKTT